MDHAVNGYLFNYINFAILSTDELTYSMHGILLALSHLQDHQIVHRDVKPASIREYPRMFCSTTGCVRC